MLLHTPAFTPPHRPTPPHPKTHTHTHTCLQNQTSHVRAERDALASADNPWIVNLHYSFQDDDYLYLVMDYCAGGDLMALLIKEDVLPEAWVKFYAAEAILALESVHAMGYIHRDIKPDNMLLDHRGHLKLTDLGLCKKVDDDIPAGLDTVHEAGESAAAAAAGGGGGSSSELESHHAYMRDRKLAYSTVGTPDYIDYQVLLKKGYSFEADWWALGTVLYECMLGFPPFYGDDPVQTCRKILHYKTTLKFPADRIRSLSPQAIDFLRSLITDADHRLGTRGALLLGGGCLLYPHHHDHPHHPPPPPPRCAGGAAEIRAHPWFAGFDWEHLATMAAPWTPPNGKVIGELLEKLATLPREHKDFEPTLRALTANFDDFSKLAADDPRAAFAGGAAVEGGAAKGGASKRFANKFVGFTFKRAPDGKPALGGPPGAAAGGSGGGT